MSSVQDLICPGCYIQAVIYPDCHLTKMSYVQAIVRRPLYVVFASKPVVWLHCNEAAHHFDCLTSQNLGDHSN